MKQKRISKLFLLLPAVTVMLAACALWKPDDPDTTGENTQETSGANETSTTQGIEQYVGNVYFRYNIDTNSIIKFSESDVTKTFPLTETQYQALNQYPGRPYAEKFVFGQNELTRQWIEFKEEEKDSKYQLKAHFNEQTYNFVELSGRFIEPEMGAEIIIGEGCIAYSESGFYVTEAFAQEHDYNIYTIDQRVNTFINLLDFE